MVDPKGTYLFIDRDVWEIGCPIALTPALFAGSDKRSPPRWANPQRYPGMPGSLRHSITADSARPETIDHMKALGFLIKPAIKGPGSVEDGIEFLKGYDIIVHPRCTHLLDELIHYCWAIDRVSGEILPRLADRKNHVIDALRYALEGARRGGSDGFTFQSSGRRVSLGGSAGYGIDDIWRHHGPGGFSLRQRWGGI